MAHISIYGASLEEDKEPEAQRKQQGRDTVGLESRAFDHCDLSPTHPKQKGRNRDAKASHKPYPILSTAVTNMESSGHEGAV
jgi:hypothetical protein